MRLTLGAVLLVLSRIAPAGPADPANLLEWSALAPLPDHIGLAGPIAGAHDGHLIVAGGANFPDAPLWEGDKAWHDAIWVLPSGGSWRRAEADLPTELAYPVTLTHPDRGVIVVGGSTGRAHTGASFLMTFAGGDVSITPLPTLPTPTAYATGTLVGDVVCIIGGQDAPDANTASRTLWMLDLSSEVPAWRRGPDLPGEGRILAVAGTCKNRIYLFGGASLEPDTHGQARRTYLTDAWSIAPDETQWTRLADVPRAVTAAPSPAIPVGHDHLVIVGGDDGRHAGQADILRDTHPGFNPGVLSYNVITDAWASRGVFPTSGDAPGTPSMPPVTTTTVPWNGGFIMPSGEIRPRVRTPGMPLATPVPTAGTLASVDWIVITGYLLVLLAMGIYFSRREKTTEDFFLGGRRIPWWAAGISIFATGLSAITFMAIPAKAFETDWVYFVQSLGIPIVAVVVAWLFLPFYRRLGLTTAYEYLEKRFGLTVRLLGSGQFILAQTGRVAVVVFLPALALSAVTGIDVTLCIALMGLLSIVYTVLGGIEVVVWSDVLQAVILTGGALLAAWIMIDGIPGGIGAAWDQAAAADKLHMVNHGFDLTQAVILVVVLGAIFNNIIPYVSDQAVVQRYLTTPDEHSAKIAIWTGGFLAIPSSLLFFGLGTLLWAYYRANPENLGPTGAVDQILPWFILNEMPAGISGLVIAAILAAAMSSIDSSMNSVSTAFTTDFYRRFRPEIDNVQALTVARWVTVVFGLIGTCAALLIATIDVQSVLDLWFKMLGLFASGLCGLFFLGILSRRAGSEAAIAGLLVSAGVNLVIGTWTDVNVLLIGTFGLTSCLVTGLLVSIVCPSTKPLEGLTLASRPPASA